MTLVAVDRELNIVGAPDRANADLEPLLGDAGTTLSADVSACVSQVFTTGSPVLGRMVRTPSGRVFLCSCLPLLQSSGDVDLVQVLVQPADAVDVTPDLLDIERTRGQLAAIVESASDGIVSKSLEGIVQSWNRGAERMFGYRAEEIVGHSITKLIPKDRLAEEDLILSRVQRGERVPPFETVRLHKDGRELVVSLTVSPVRDSRGRIIGASKVVQDISGRKLAEDALRRREEEMEIITDAVPALISFVDADLRYRFCNRTYERWFGVERNAILGQHMRDVLGEHAFEALRSYAERALHGETVRFETWTEYRSGGSRYIDAHYLPRHGSRGEVEGFFILVSDLTERQLEGERLRESEERFRLVAETIPGVVFTNLPDGRCAYVNSRWYEFTGTKPHSAEGLGWVDALHPEDREQTLQRWRSALTAGEPFEQKYRLRAADGRYRWAILRSKPLKGADGSVSKWLGVCTDIDDLVQAQEALKESHRRKDEFLAMLAHELRNPLAPVMTAVEVLQLQPEVLGGKVGWAMDIIERQTQHLAHLVDDLLDIARIVSGRIQLRRTTIDIVPLAAQAVENVRARAQSKGLRQVASVSQEPLYVFADAGRITQILDNLLDNAVKYTDGGGTVRFEVRKEHAQAVLRVKDTGIGIAAEDLPRIFELFEQAEPGFDRAQGGLGLGLNLVQRLVQKHGGSVEVHSRGRGHGSEFIVRLPLVEPQALAAEAAALDDSGSQTPRKVLIVEDNGDIAEALQALLEAMGHHARTAPDGPSCLEMIEESKPDLVLLDLGLPGMNGYEVAQTLRRRYPPGTLRLVALTGYGREEDRRRSEEAGFDQHLVKPVDHDALAALLGRDPEPAHAPS